MLTREGRSLPLLDMTLSEVGNRTASGSERIKESSLLLRR